MCDGGGIGCLNTLTRTYTTGRRQHYSRRSRTSSHEHIHCKAWKREQHTFNTPHKTECSEEIRMGSIWMIKVLKPTKRLCQMRLQSHTRWVTSHGPVVSESGKRVISPKRDHRHIRFVFPHWESSHPILGNVTPDDLDFRISRAFRISS